MLSAGHSLECTSLLLKHGADPNVRIKWKEPGTALKVAIKHENIACQELLIEKGAAMNGCLHFAVKEFRDASVISLLQLGADVNEKYRGKTPSTLACVHDREDYLRLFMDHNAEQSLSDLVLNAAQNGSSKCLHLLLSTESDNQDRSELIATGLKYAVEYGHLSCLKLLVQEGGDVQVKVLNATKSNFFDVTEVLLEAGARVDIKEALNEAVRSEKWRFVELFVHHGAYYKDFVGKTYRKCLEFDKTLNLRILCRKSIRESIIRNYPGTNLCTRVKGLPLPRALLNFVVNIPEVNL